MQPNYSVVVNYKKRGFGCAKACSYCNWRTSDLLPHGIQSYEEILKFAEDCPKDFVTLSGGGDPMWNLEEHSVHFMRAAGAIRDAGKKVRVITREIETAAKYKKHVDYFSFSLDQDVMTLLKSDIRYSFEGCNVEATLVMPSLRTEGINRIFDQYLAIRRSIGFRLVLRENLNSPFELDFKAIRKHSAIVYAPKSQCLEGKYLLTDGRVARGAEFLADIGGLCQQIADTGAHIIGGFVNQRLDPLP